MQHQMGVLNPIYVAPNMTVLAKMTILNIRFALSNEHDSVHRIFPVAKRDINRGTRYEPKNN